MTKLKAVVVAVAMAIGFTGASSGQGKTDPALDNLAKEFMTAFNAKDAAKIAAFYADDAVVMPPNHAIVKGRAAIETYFKGEFKQDMNLQLRPMESSAAGTHAFEAGTSTVTIKDSGAAITDNGKYLTVFKRAGSDWKIAYDIFNSDQAPPAPKK
jgi:uncharacterized protein (TIGR02246 family)